MHSKERQPDEKHSSRLFDTLVSFKQKTPSFMDSSRTIIQPIINLNKLKSKDIAACKENFLTYKTK